MLRTDPKYPIEKTFWLDKIMLSRVSCFKHMRIKTIIIISDFQKFPGNCGVSVFLYHKDKSSTAIYLSEIKP